MEDKRLQLARMNDDIEVMRPQSLLSKVADLFSFKQSTDAPAYPRNQPYTSNYFSSWFSRFYRERDTVIDYRSEVGNLWTSSLVMAAVNWVALNLPEANPALVTETNGEQEFDYEAEVVAMIRRPNRYNIWANYAYGIALDWMCDGNVYFHKDRNAGGKCVGLSYLPAIYTKPRWLNDGGSPEVPASEVDDENRWLSHYEYKIDGKTMLYSVDNIIHIKRGLNVEQPRLGVGVFDSLLTEIYGDKKAGFYTSTILRNLGIVVPLASPKDPNTTISEESARHIKERWQQGVTGDRAGELMVNPIALDVTKFGFTPAEMDLSAMRKIFEARVSAATNIPAAVLQFLVGQENGTSYASYAEARKQAYESCIIPILSQLQEQFTWQLLPEFNAKKNQYIEFNTDEVRVLQEGEDAVYKRASEALRSGGITLNEYRAMIGQNPLSEGANEAGDIFFIPSLSKPTTQEELLNPPETPEPTVPIDPALAKLVDMDRYLESLERQMEAFRP